VGATWALSVCACLSSMSKARLDESEDVAGVAVLVSPTLESSLEPEGREAACLGALSIRLDLLPRGESSSPELP